jgi:nucleoside-diphosphate-sugar epimerase
MTVLLTGFPGFLGSALLPHILRREDRALCIVQRRFAALAEQRLEALTHRDASLEGRVELIEGDITSKDLALQDPQAAAAQTTELWHLAAVYDLAVPRHIGMRVNVDGTRNVLDFAERCPNLERLQYFSTCYVSGRYAGPYAEQDLDVHAPFNNFYEETKHLAEQDVRHRMQRGLPATIYRPSIVVGDSETGDTQKFDGPYFVMQWLMRQRRVALMPVVGDPTVTRLNVVPRDFVIRATAHLSGLQSSEGKTYQLADPQPQTIRELLDTLSIALGRRIVSVPVSRRMARRAVERIPGVYRMLRIPAEAVDYFAHPTHYLTDNTRADLAGTGIAVPPFSAYVAQLVDFMRAHPEVGVAAMV